MGSFAYELGVAMAALPAGAMEKDAYIPGMFTLPLAAYGAYKAMKPLSRGWRGLTGQKVEDPAGGGPDAGGIGAQHKQFANQMGLMRPGMMKGMQNLAARQFGQQQQWNQLRGMFGGGFGGGGAQLGRFA